LSFPLCMSRACLGTMIIFRRMKKWVKGAISYLARGWRDGGLDV
jgi:hypothetical protein